MMIPIKIKILRNNQVRVKKKRIKRKRKVRLIIIPKRIKIIKTIVTQLKMATKETTKIKTRNQTNKILNNSCRRKTSAQMTLPIDSLLHLNL